MARNVAMLALGIVVGVVAGAALGARAADGMGGDGGLTGVDGSSEAGGMSPASAVPDLTVDAAPAQQSGVWDRLAACESSGIWSRNSGNGYFGGLQFDRGTWLRHGGAQFAPRADLASRAQQIVVAQRTLAAQGWSAWPVCSRVIGVR
jgi:Transglycosylase-like domain